MSCAELAHSKLQAAPRAKGSAARRLPPTNEKRVGEQCSRRDAVQFGAARGGSPPGQRAGGLSACALGGVVAISCRLKATNIETRNDILREPLNLGRRHRKYEKLHPCVNRAECLEPISFGQRQALRTAR
jgi:hypothetical protein